MSARQNALIAAMRKQALWWEERSFGDRGLRLAAAHTAKLLGEAAAALDERQQDKPEAEDA